MDDLLVKTNTLKYVKTHFFHYFTIFFILIKAYREGYCCVCYSEQHCNIELDRFNLATFKLELIMEIN